MWPLAVFFVAKCEFKPAHWPSCKTPLIGTQEIGSVSEHVLFRLKALLVRDGCMVSHAGDGHVINDEFLALPWESFLFLFLRGGSCIFNGKRDCKKVKE